MANNNIESIFKFSPNTYSSSSTREQNDDGSWVEISLLGNGFKIETIKDINGYTTISKYDPYGNPCGRTIKDPSGRVVDVNKREDKNIFDM